jgi:hypothetical protein
MGPCGCNSMAESGSSKAEMRVRLPSSALPRPGVRSKSQRLAQRHARIERPLGAAPYPLGRDRRGMTSAGSEWDSSAGGEESDVPLPKPGHCKGPVSCPPGYGAVTLASSPQARSARLWYGMAPGPAPRACMAMHRTLNPGNGVQVPGGALRAGSRTGICCGFKSRVILRVQVPPRPLSSRIVHGGR